MPRFAYRVRDQKGALVSGEADAPDLNVVQEELFRQGMIPLAVREVKPGAITLDSLMAWQNKVKAEELMVFTRQFYTLFRAGVSMDTILTTMAKQSRSKAMRTALAKIRTDIANGASLSQAFAQHRRGFNDLYISLLAARGEAGVF